MSMIAQYVHKAIEAATPWLVGTAVGFFLLWLAMLIREKKPFAKELKWFSGLAPLHKFIVVCAVCFFTLWGGSKERGILPSGLIDDISSTVSRVIETVQPRSLPEDISTNALAITEFEIDQTNRTAYFETRWATNLFDYTDSRNLYLFSSTNLLERKWTPLCMIPMPADTNVHSFVVTQNDVMPSMRHWFVDAFGGVGFYRFGVDFDSDGDGIADDIETLWTFTDPAKFDTDGDGLSDGLELSPRVNTNPLAYDTDGDGVGDGDEVASGSNPRRVNSDQDGLSDAQELGAMTALVENDFMWFDMSAGTDLLSDYSTLNSYSWKIPLASETVVNEVCYTNARVCVDGTVHLLCPTNVNDWYAHYYGNLSNLQWSASHLTVALCGANLYARTSDWDSKILYGSLVSEGRTFDVVEYRNMGLYDHDDTNELITCQLILPHDETNTIYVSYLCASNTFREVSFAAGIQCGWLPSSRPGESFYNLSWPIIADFPQDGLTIRYSIGTCTDPSKTDTDGDGLSDSEEVLSYRTNPLVADTDGDGIPDGVEVSVGTDPRSVDTDEDGMPDGWEAYYGLNPLVDDSSLDADNDGLANRAEYEFGTNPAEADTDEDGIGDRDELGWWEYSSTLPAFSNSNVTNLISSSSGYDDDMFLVDLPFEVRFAGYRATKAKVSVNGFVWLVADVGEVPTSSDYGNQNLSSNVRSQYHGFVAAYWDDLYAYSGRNAQLSVAEAYSNGQRYCVIKYQNISIRGEASNMGTFRVVIPESETNAVYVAYDSLASGFNGAGATIGAQSPNMGCNFPVAYNESGSVSNGMVIAYHFGTGSNPLMADTDGDGLEDGVEMSIGTSPCCSDTDNDGLDDEWEHVNGLDPLSDTGNEGADGDKDEDGLCNLAEYKIGTSPVVADTDGDGVLDSAETGVLDVSGTLTWVSLPADAVDVTSRFSDADGSLIDYELSTPVSVNGEKLSTVVIDVNGIVYLPRLGCEGDFSVKSGANLEYAICPNALVLAPYLDDLYMTANEPTPKVSVAETSVGTEQVLVVQYENVCPYSNRSRTYTTNALSFQVVVPLNGGNVHFLYKDIVGSDMNGRYADIGVQMLGGRWAHAYTYSKQDRVKGNGNPMRAFFTQGSLCNGLDLVFNIGSGSSPLLPDSDGDGMNDGAEMASGTSPITADTDGDELPDNWEVLNNLDPLSAIGDDGASGDPDGDGVDNFAEYELGTNPHLADTDNDGLSDGKEVVCVSFANSLPWLEVSVLTNLTEAITNAYGRVVSWDLPSPVLVQRETATNITINTRGVVCLNRAGYNHPNYSHSPYNLQTETVDTNAFVVSAYGGYLNLYDEDNASAVKIGTAEYDGMGYIMVEYDNMYQDRPSYTTNAVSFQVAIPTGQVDRISVNYADVVGTYMDGRNAIIGCQSFGADDRVSYCRYEQGKIYDGMSMAFMVGYGSDPLVADTDSDGISDGVEVNTYGSDPRLTDTDADGLMDAQEAVLGTSLNNPDSDGDGLLDGWEVANSFNPLSAPGNGESGVDTDGDGLTNLQEQAAGSNPRNADSDGDGLSDYAEFLTHHTNPLVADTDGDGMTDKQETDANYDPLDPDMDRDGMPDGWENAHGLDPQSATGDDGADGDYSDHDGLSNIDEYLNGTNPNLPDSDNDGVSDAVEVANGSDPNNASDGGQAPAVDKFREIEFNINGDYAAWEMTIEGLGPDDTRIRKISIGRPNAANTTTLKMRKGNSYRLSMRWLNCDGHNDDRSPWYCWLAQLDGLPSGYTFSSYTNTRREGHEVVVGNGWIADNEDGLLTSHVHECTTQSDGSSGGGNVAGGLTATLYVLDDPKLIPDYDRDGMISNGDKTKAEQRKVLHFWINDDEDDDSTEGKYAESPSVDIPGARTGWLEFDGRDPDWNDSKVNGYRDLIDFTPVFMDVSAIQILPEKIRNSLSFKLRHDSEAVNVVWTAMSKSSVSSFPKGTVNNCGRNLNEASYKAETEEVESDGIDVPDALAAQMRTASTDKGVAFIEGCLPVNAPLKLDIYYGEDKKVVTGELPLHLSSVEEMYWFYSIRGAENNPSIPIPNSNSPGNLMENPADIDIFFTHGFNVDADAARGWGSEVFKRLWQSGSNARFRMVTWAGDYRFGEDMNPFEFMNGFFYHRDVQYALNSADVYKRLVSSVQANSSKRVLMAQSLGNMVTCEAIRLGLGAGKYYMFNAAVASEAIVGTLQNANDTIRQKFVPPDWRSYNSLSWAANWYRWFPNDDRAHLGWPGYFTSHLSGISEVCNYYSSGDPVLVSNTDVPSALTKTLYVQWPVTFSWSWPFIRFQSFEFQATFERFAWQKQEVLKGVNPYLATREGGWGFHTWPVDLPNGETEWRTFTAQDASEMVSNGSIITNAVFERSVSAMFSPTISLADRNRILAYNVPAVSESTGSVPTFESQSKFVNLNSSGYKNGWGRSGNPYNDQWLHSDMKDMAYYYVYRLYDELVQKIQGGAQ